MFIDETFFLTLLCFLEEKEIGSPKLEEIEEEIGNMEDQEDLLFLKIEPLKLTDRPIDLSPEKGKEKKNVEPGSPPADLLLTLGGIDEGKSKCILVMCMK